MRLHTENEFLTQNRRYAYKLRCLYLSDNTLFNQVVEFLPFPIHINEKRTYKIFYANDKLQNIGPEVDDLLEKGPSHLPKISNPFLLEKTFSAIDSFSERNDFNEICNHLQQIRVRNKMTYFFSNKLILTNKLFFNISHFQQDLGIVSKIIENILGPLPNDQSLWHRFHSLTKQEKIVLKMLANGLRNTGK